MPAISNDHFFWLNNFRVRKILAANLDKIQLQVTDMQIHSKKDKRDWPIIQLLECLDPEDDQFPMDLGQRNAFYGWICLQRLRCGAGKIASWKM